MLISMVVIAALLAGAAVLVSMQMASNRQTALTLTSDAAMYCSEAGLAAARPVVTANYASWAGALATYPSTDEPQWLSDAIGSHDLDGDGNPDFTVYIKDNDDEVAPATNDPLHDSDLRVFIVARCLTYGDSASEVEELVRLAGAGTCYKSQVGGCRNDGNTN
jgi:hypothetical protein